MDLEATLWTTRTGGNFSESHKPNVHNCSDGRDDPPYGGPACCPMYEETEAEPDDLELLIVPQTRQESKNGI